MTELRHDNHGEDEPFDGIGIAPSVRVIESNITAAGRDQASAIARRAAIDSGYVVVDQDRPIEVGNGCWAATTYAVAVSR